jgi:hypothetical protein
VGPRIHFRFIQCICIYRHIVDAIWGYALLVIVITGVSLPFVRRLQFHLFLLVKCGSRYLVLGWAVLLSPVLALNVTLLDCEMCAIARPLLCAMLAAVARRFPVSTGPRCSPATRTLSCVVLYKNHIVYCFAHDRKHSLCPRQFVGWILSVTTATNTSTVSMWIEMKMPRWITPHFMLSLCWKPWNFPANFVICNPSNTTIIIREGIHAIPSTIMLGPKDSGLSLVGYPREDAWLSGGIEIPKSTKWTPFQQKILVANLTNLLLHMNASFLVSFHSFLKTKRRD